MTINYNVGKLGRNDKTANYIVQFDTSSGIVPSNINVSNNVVNVSGSLTASSGNFNSLSVSGIPVSISGHTHVSLDIIDFNTSVSGLLPKISNSGDNRILTSTGSTVGINAENNLTFDGSLLNVSGNFVAQTGTINSLNFNNIGDPAIAIQQLTWNNSEGSLQLGLSNNYAMFIGGELHYRVRNNTGSTLLAGTAVYATGLTPGGNNRIEIAPKAADGSIREVRFMGLMTEDCNSGFNGYTTHFGYIRGLDTRGDASANGTTNKLWTDGEPSWAEGDILYVHPTAAGKLTKIEPKHSISVAIILNRHQQQGKLFVRPTSYGHLGDNHDVDTSGATNGQFLQYNSSTDYWLPSSSGNFTSLSVGGIAVSVSGHTHGIIGYNGEINASENSVLMVDSAGYVAARDDLADVRERLGITDELSHKADLLHTHGNITNSGTIGSTSGLLITTGASGILITSSGISSSLISNFNSSVSGLLAVKNITAGSGISINNNSGIFTINSSGISNINISGVSGIIVSSSGNNYTIGIGIIDCGVIVPSGPSLTTPLAAYPFDSNVNSTNPSYNGTAFGSPSFVTGRVNNAIQLNTGAKYVTIPRSISTNWTIAFFVNTSSSSPSYSNWYDGVSLVNGEAPGSVNDFGITYLNNKVAFGVGNPDTTLLSNSLINTGTWKHVTCTRNSSTGQMKIYIDGIFETSMTGPTGAKTAFTSFVIGGSIKYGSFNGLIDNLKIYDSILTDSEISLLAGGS